MEEPRLHASSMTGGVVQGVHVFSWSALLFTWHTNASLNSLTSLLPLLFYFAFFRCGKKAKYLIPSISLLHLSSVSVSHYKAGSLNLLYTVYLHSALIFFLTVSSIFPPAITHLSCGHPQWRLVRQACHCHRWPERKTSIYCHSAALLICRETRWARRRERQMGSWVGNWKADVAIKWGEKPTEGGASYPWNTPDLQADWILDQHESLLHTSRAPDRKAEWMRHITRDARLCGKRKEGGIFKSL